MSTDHTQTEGELERLRAEVERLTAITKAQGQNVSWMSYHDACAGRDAAGRRALKAEVTLTRVRVLCEAKEDAQRRANEHYAERNIVEAKTGRVFEGVPILTCREVRAALDPATPAPSPDSASTGDTGTRAGSAPSEGRSEARGAHPGLISMLTCECCGQDCDCGCIEDCPAPSCRARVRPSDGA